MTSLIILLCYLHQPVGLYFEHDGQASLDTYASAPVSAESKTAMRDFCAADLDDLMLQENFKVWHLDKLNGHIWTSK